MHVLIWSRAAMALLRRQIKKHEVTKDTKNTTKKTERRLLLRFVYFESWWFSSAGALSEVAS